MDEWKKYTFDQKQIFLAFAGNCLILLLVFILGVKVGKAFFSGGGLPSDEEILKKIKPEETSVTFPETLMDGGKKYMSEVSVPKNLPVIPSPPPPMSAQKAETVDKNSSTTKPAAAKTAAAKPTTSKDDHYKYSVQLASFLKISDARKMVEHYEKRGFKPYIVTIRFKNRTRYRVRVGKYKTKAEGFKVMKVFVRKYGLKPLLIQL